MNKCTSTLIIFYAASFVHSVISETLTTLTPLTPLTPDSFRQSYIDITECHWSYEMCNSESFINSNLDIVKDGLAQNCRNIYDHQGDIVGMEPCHPDQRSRAWFNNECIKKGECTSGKTS